MGCVFAELCGEVFHRLPVQVEEDMLQEYERQWTAIEATGRKSWPASVRQVIGSIGEFLLDDCLAVDPRDRPSASQAANHMYLHPERLGLGGTVEGDRLAERGFVPLVAPESFRGTRHDWNVLAGNVGVETVEWLRGDFANKEHLKVDFEASRGDAKSEAGLKYILAGKMVEEPASLTMCTLSIAKVLPLPRLRAFWASFKAVPHTHLRAHETGRNLVCRLLLEKKKRNSYANFCLNKKTKYTRNIHTSRTPTLT